MGEEEVANLGRDQSGDTNPPEKTTRLLSIDKKEKSVNQSISVVDLPGKKYF